ncbi:MAG: GNAT family N-acetyltransferase [Burkholderiales bacterium]
MSKRLLIVPKNQLSDEQRRYLDERLAVPEHRNDKGPLQVWNKYERFLYAYIHKELNLPIALAQAPGRPVASPAWWIDSKFRGQGYGNEVVDLLAEFLKKDGVTDIGAIQIESYCNEYDEQSTRLARRIRSRFGEPEDR